MSDKVKEIEQPKTLEDCFRILKEINTEAGIKMFGDYLEGNALAMSHHGFGTFLRNNWFLWWSEELAKDFKVNGYPQEKPAIVKFFNEEYKIFHADDISSMILMSFHRTLNDKPIDLEGQAKRYHKFWEKNKK